MKRVSIYRSAFTRASIMTALLLCAPMSALAQMPAGPSPRAPPPAREGDIYDFREHQPTQPAAPAASTTEQVENEIKALLRQTDELDRTFDKKEEGSPDQRWKALAFPNR